MLTPKEYRIIREVILEVLDKGTFTDKETGKEYHFLSTPLCHFVRWNELNKLLEWNELNKLLKKISYYIRRKN